MKFILAPEHVQAMLPGADRFPRRVPDFAGAPWIAGEWADDECVVAITSAVKLVLIGTVGLQDDALQTWLEAQGASPRFEDIHRSVPGAFFTIASHADGRKQSFGTLSGFRRISYTTDPALPLASNSLRLLVEALQPDLREDRIPLALLAPRAPWPLGEASYWSGIENLLPTEQLRQDRDDRFTTAVRWSLPTRHVPLIDIAAELQQALHGAIEARARLARTSLSSDLSGGMDSTAISFFARAHVPELTTIHLGISVEMNDDAEWAADAADALGSRHLRVTSDDLPKWFSGWRTSAPRFAAEPEASIRTEGMHREMARRLHEHGCTIHLAGSGADELFYPDEAVLQGLRRESPALVYRAVRSMSTVHRWPFWKTLAAAMNTSDAGDWLLTETAKLGQDSFERPSPAWDVPFSLSPWATGAVSDAVRSLISELAFGRSLETEFATDSLAFGMIIRNGQIHRALDEKTREVGVRYEAPFLDDAVIETALRIRLADRLNTGRFKPGLAAASQGVVPERFLSRRSKGDYISLIYEAFREHRHDIEAELPQFHLVRRGLIDDSVFRAYLLGMQPSPEKFYPFEFLLATERWLRSAEESTITTRR